MTRPILEPTSLFYIRIASAIHKRITKVVRYFARVSDQNASDRNFGGLRMGGTRRRRIHLTFDDGPHPINTPKLLDELKQAGILATFYVVGKKLETPHGKELIARAAAEGHQIGNHTYSHHHLNELSEDEIREEITKTERLIGDADRGVKTFRPPYGEHNTLVDRVVQRLGYSPAFWNVDSGDWDSKFNNGWVDHTMDLIKTHENTLVILAHDTNTFTVGAVGILIANIRKLSDCGFIEYSEAFPNNNENS
jgi:peptidoglycan/xylan/chitin deacetylase (PgdA/CDA1 family)